MSIILKTIDSSFSEVEKLAQINTDAFPEEERMSVERLMELSAAEDFTLLAACDGDAMVGFTLLGVSDTCVYVFLLAVDKEQRSKGYGSQILRELKNRFAGQQIVLDLEGIDEQAENNAQRISRKRFYLRNGFCETGYFMDYFGIRFEVLCGEENLNVSNFVQLLDRLNGYGFHLAVYQGTDER